MPAPLIRLTGVGKDYPAMAGGASRLRTLWSLLRRGTIGHAFHALRDVSFDVMPGESLGFVGENGAGKSTLLKIIAGVVRPSAGTVAVTGRIGALLELGAGFHPEYTGRENIYLSASLLGMGRAEVLRHIDEIVAFADIGEHIDQPIKHYSSGMVVRLGFAVATAMNPQILITDEVLAVGDESFQKKCITWMENYLAGGGTLLLCSHGMFHIQKLCQKAIWIHHGAMRAIGSAADVTREYLAYHEEKARLAKPQTASALPPVSAELYQLRQMQVNGCPVDTGPHRMAQGDALTVSGSVHSPDGRRPQIAIGLVRADGSGIYGVVSDMDAFQLEPVSDHEFAFGLRFPDLPLLPGRYLVRGHAMDPEGLRMLDHVEATLDVTGETRELGVCRLAHHWYIP